MFVRVTWLGIGMVAGAVGARWAERRVRRAVAQLGGGAAGDLAALGRAAKEDVRAALAEGRRAMVEREAELRAAIEQPRAARPSIAAPSRQVIDVGGRTAGPGGGSGWERGGR